VSAARWWIGLGSNLGDRRAMLQRAVDALRAAGVEVEAVAGLWETAPRDLEDQPAFLNSAVRVRSALDPPAMLALVKAVERDLGREAGGVRYGPRPIDCDLLAWGGGAWESADLRIPHERLAERRFAMLPLLDLDPDLRLPDGTVLAEACAAIDPAAQPAGRWPGPGLV
jgi:2-amino-4-hydroxy-6-hydroxymethyldihydropteridine diphosphokinase